jgi:hypothetical protein
MLLNTNEWINLYIMPKLGNTKVIKIQLMYKSYETQLIPQFMYVSYSIQLANAAQQILIKTCANKFCSANCYIVKVVIYKLR